MDTSDPAPPLADAASAADFTPVREVGEFGLIDRMAARLVQPRPAGLVEGIGDDCAVYTVAPGRVHVVTTDALVEGVHFDRAYAPLGMVGWKAIATAVSDVVAMNADPLYATVALGLPNNVSVEGAETLYDGIDAACAAYGLTVVGGDTTASARLTLSVTVIGEAAEADVVYRRGAQPGDVLVVTGDLGAAAAGLQVLLAGTGSPEAEGDSGPEAARAVRLQEFAYAVERQLMPQARLDRVRAWRAAGVRPTALIDVSDGLASEVHHICGASAVGAVIEAGLLPVHVQTFKAAERFETRADAYALYGGEDYELLAAFSEADVAKLPEGTVAIVGRVVEPEDGVVLALPDGRMAPLRASGYKHY